MAVAAAGGAMHMAAAGAVHVATAGAAVVGAAGAKHVHQWFSARSSPLSRA